MPIYLGDRITLEATFIGSDNIKYNPDSIEFKIFDPQNGVDFEGTEDDLTHVETGIFEYDYDIPLGGLPGTWRVVWKGISGGGAKREKMSFDVINI